MNTTIITPSEEVVQNVKDEELTRQYNLMQTKLDLCKDGMNLIDKAMDVYNESQHIKRDIAAIQAHTTAQLAKVAATYSLCEMALKETFSERREALQKHYSVLDEAVKKGDRDLVIRALSGISTIVSESPLQSFEAMLKAWDDKSKPLELDF